MKENCVNKMLIQLGDDIIWNKLWKLCFALWILYVSIIIIYVASIDSKKQNNNNFAVSAEISCPPVMAQPTATCAIEQMNYDPDTTPEPTVEPKYTEEELYMISHLINGEAGASWASDIHQQLVGLVAINRTQHSAFPDTIEEVIFAPGQYACTWDGNYDKEPSERAIENAKKVLSGTTDIECPPNVVFQSTQKLGDGVFHKIHDKILNNTTYFCYINN